MTNNWYKLLTPRGSLLIIRALYKKHDQRVQKSRQTILKIAKFLARNLRPHCVHKTTKSAKYAKLPSQNFYCQTTLKKFQIWHYKLPVSS